MTEFDTQDVRYVVKKGSKEKFQGNVLRLAEKTLCKINKVGGTEDLDKTLCTPVSDEIDIENLIEEYHEVLKLTCSKSFRTQRASKKAMSNKTVPMWTEELRVMRKRVNAQRRGYQKKRKNKN